LLHLGRHLTLDNLQRILLLGGKQLAQVANGEASFAQQLPDLVRGAIRPVRAGRLKDVLGRRRRMFLARRIGLERCDGLRLEIGRLWHSLRIGVSR